MSIEKASLYELGLEYERHIELQECFIGRCRADLKRARAARDGKAVRELQSNLYKFYEIRRELTASAEHLKSYYEE